MASKKPIIGETKRNGPETESSREDVQPGNVDDLVSSFLVELTSLSSEIRQVRRHETVGSTPEKDVCSSGSTQTGSSPIAGDEETGISDEPCAALENIDEQISQSLDELEHLKSNAATIAAPEDSGPLPAPPALESEVPLRIEGGADLSNAQNEGLENIEESSAAARSQDPPGASLQFRRSTLFSSNLGQRQRRTSIPLVVAVVVVILVVLLIYLFRYNTTPANVGSERSASTFDSEAAATKELGSQTGVVSSGGTPLLEPDPEARQPPSMRSNGGDIFAAPKSSSSPGMTMTAVEVLERVLPTYPALARSLKISGRVQLEIYVDGKGNVANATAVSGPFSLRGAAEEAVKKWKFKPASVNGINVASKATVTVNFDSQ